MKEQMCDFNEELVAYVLNPDRLSRMAAKLGVSMEDIVSMY